jgi:hypothetical protein
MHPDMLLALDEKLFDFDKNSGWRLSLPAKIVLQQAFVSLATDYLGLEGYTNAERRQQMIGRVLEQVQPFLIEIRSKATDAAKAQNLVSSNERLIGAIYIIQNMKRLADLVSCECWPG